jgi:hypothetical protein
LEKWLSLLEGYFSVQNFSNSEKSPSHSLNLFPMLDIGGKLTVRNMSEMNLQFLGQNPLGWIFFDALKEKYYLVGNYDD